MASRKSSQESYSNNDSLAQRRAFMKLSGGCAALGSTSLLSQILSLQLTGAAYANSGNTSTSGYKALVCVFLNGGMDTFDMLTPFENAEWATYNSVRLFAARPKANPPSGSTATAVTAENPELIPLRIDRNVSTTSGRQLGLNGLMPELATLYNQGDLAFLANVGSLVRPTNRTDYNNNVSRPLGLFSHADLLKHWQTSVPQSRSQATGWAGRMADLINGTSNPNSKVSMNIALGTDNLFQTGTSVLPYVVGSGGVTRLKAYRFFTDPETPIPSNPNAWSDISPAARIHNRVLNGVRIDASGNVFHNGTLAEQNAGLLSAMYPTADTAAGELYSNLLQRTLALKKRASIDVADMFSDATSISSTGGVISGPGALPLTAQQGFSQIASATSGPTAISSTMRNLSANLNMVARIIQARSAFGQQRQIFFVNVGGWDMHDYLRSNMASAMPGLSKALKAFYDATVGMGVSNDVVTFTASDFGRTLNPNSTGTDHGWGGNQIIMGGSVVGGKVYGDYPTSLAANQLIDLGRGRLIPSTSVDVYNAELARWFGIPNNSALQTILPNIRNFYADGATTMPLGMLPSG